MDLVQRTRRVLREIHTADDVSLLLRLTATASLVRLAKRRVPIAALVRQAVPRVHVARTGAEPRRIALFASWAARIARGGGDSNCLERSLAVYRELLRAGR